MANQYDPHTHQNLWLWLKLFKVSSAIEVTLQERLRHQCKTTLPRFDVMAALDHHPRGLRMNELSRYLRVSKLSVWYRTIWLSVYELTRIDAPPKLA